MTFIRLGEGFRHEPEPEPEIPEVVPSGPLPEEVFAQAVRELRDSLEAMPPPVVTTESIDLAEIVNAIQGLKGPATAGEIADALALRIVPSQPQGEGAVVAAIRELVEKVDFRMKGMMPAYGASGPSNIADNADRLLGHVTVDNFPAAGLTDTELRADPVVVSGTFFQETQPVSLAAAPVTPVTDNDGSLTVDGTVAVSNLTCSTPTVTTFAAATADAEVAAANAARRGLTIFNNNATANLFVRLGATAATSSVFTVKVAAGGYYELPSGYTGALHGIWDAAVGNGALVTELT